MRLSDLPPALREQAERQLGLSVKRTPNAPLCNGSTAGFEPAGEGSNPSGATKAKQKPKNAIRIPRERRPNKTEDFFNRSYLLGKGKFEAVRLRLAGGEHYTPDFMAVDGNGRICLYEVKGSYRLKPLRNIQNLCSSGLIWTGKTAGRFRTPVLTGF